MGVGELFSLFLFVALENPPIFARVGVVVVPFSSQHEGGGRTIMSPVRLMLHARVTMCGTWACALSLSLSPTPPLFMSTKKRSFINPFALLLGSKPSAK